MKKSEKLKLLAKSGDGSFNKNEYNKICKELEKAATDGKFFIWYYKKISNSVQLKLIDEGFSINEISDRDGLLIKISFE